MVRPQWHWRGNSGVVHGVDHYAYTRCGLEQGGGGGYAVPPNVALTCLWGTANRRGGVW